MFFHMQGDPDLNDTLKAEDDDDDTIVANLTAELAKLDLVPDKSEPGPGAQPREQLQSSHTMGGRPYYLQPRLSSSVGLMGLALIPEEPEELPPRIFASLSPITRPYNYRYTQKFMDYLDIVDGIGGITSSNTNKVPKTKRNDENECAPQTPVEVPLGSADGKANQDAADDEEGIVELMEQLAIRDLN